MKTHISRLTFRSLVTGTMLSVVVFGLSLVPGEKAPSLFVEVSGSQSHWLTYTDQRFGFKIDYPANWFVLSRDDTPGRVGAVLTFSNQTESKLEGATEGNSRIVVSVGLYLAEIELNQSLPDWVDLYEKESSAFDPAAIMKVEQKTISLLNRQGLLRRGFSPLGDFQVTDVQDGRVVWFIWSNADAKTLGIYSHMVSSFALGHSSPQSLQEIYGPNFRPMRLDASARSSSNNDPREVALANTGASKALHALRMEQDPAGWRLPFSGTKIITAGPGCIGTHQGASAEAIDYSMNAGTAVKSVYGGVVSWFGWNTQGYGNLLNIDYGPSPVKRAYYAHLQSFNVSYVGQSVVQGATVAYADSTGNSSGNHLHFEVRRQNTTTGVWNIPVWVRTLPTTTWYSGNPNNPCVAGNDGTATGP